MAVTTLTVKQEAFAQAVSAGRTQLEAYRLAYPASRCSDQRAMEEASKLRQHPKIAPRIAELLARVNAKYGIERDRIAERLAYMAFTDLTEVVEIEHGKFRLRDLDSLTPPQRAALKKIKVKVLRHITDGDEPVGDLLSIEVELHDQRQTLIDLGKDLGMFREQVDATFHRGEDSERMAVMVEAIKAMGPEERAAFLERMAEREAAGIPLEVTTVTPQKSHQRHTTVTREEKRRITTPLPPSSSGDQ